MTPDISSSILKIPTDRRAPMNEQQQIRTTVRQVQPVFGQVAQTF